MCRVCVGYVSGMYRVSIGKVERNRREVRGERLVIGDWLLAMGYGLLEIGYWRWVRGETIDSCWQVLGGGAAGDTTNGGELLFGLPEYHSGQ